MSLGSMEHQIERARAERAHGLRQRRRYVFGEFELDTARFELRRAGRRVAIQPKTFDVLHHLVAHHGCIISRAQLLQALWPEEHVNDTAVPWTIMHVRKALGQTGAQSSPIETVRGRGYRFVLEVRVLEDGPTAPDPASAEPHAPTPSRAAPEPGAATPLEPLVARAEEMTRLTASLDRALRGQGGVVVIRGEAGVGKSRVGAELLSLARLRGLEPVIGRCFEGELPPPFWPWIQVLRALARQPAVPDGLRGQVDMLLAELATLTRSRDREDAAPTARFWLLDRLGRLVLSFVERAPVLLLLEDLQWADEPSLQVLRFLFDEAGVLPLLIVATHRDPLSESTPTSGPLRRLLRTAQSLQLTPLTAEMTGRYVNELVSARQGGPVADAAILEVIHERTGGNPLLIREVVHHILLEHGAQGISSASARDVDVPQATRELLRARLEALEEPGVRALEAASVLGRSFSGALLATTLQTDTISLFVHLEAAVGAGLLLHEERRGHYLFCHDLLRDAVYAGLPSVARVELHMAAASALSGHRDAALPSQMAYHLYHALPCSRPQDVLHWAQQAGIAALRSLDYTDAITFFGWALEARASAGDSSPRTHAELLLQRGSARRFAGDSRGSRADLRRSVEISKQCGFVDLLARAARRTHPAITSGPVSDSIGLDALEHARALLQPGDSALRVQVLGQLSCIPPHANDMEHSKALSAEALAVARRLGERPLLLFALRTRLHALSGPDDAGALIATADEILSLDADPPTWSSAEAAEALEKAYQRQGDVDACHAAREQFRRMTERLRLPEGLVLHQRKRALDAFHAGDCQLAQKRIDACLERAKQVGIGYERLFHAIASLMILRERCGLAEMPAGWFPDTSGPLSSMTAYRAGGMVMALEAGHRAAAERIYRELVADDLASVTRDDTYLVTLAWLGEAAARLGDRTTARALYRRLLPHAQLNVVDPLGFHYGSVEYFLGLLAHELGELEVAAGHYRAALRFNGALGYPAGVARAHLGLANTLRASGGGDRAPRALEHLAAARELATRHGFGPLLAQCDAWPAKL